MHPQAAPSRTWHPCHNCAYAAFKLGRASGLAWPLAAALHSLALYCIFNGTILCWQALPSDEAVQWREKEELQDLYSVYVGRDKDTAKQSVVQKLFALSDKDAKSLKEVVDAGQFKLEAEDDDSNFF